MFLGSNLVASTPGSSRCAARFENYSGLHMATISNMTNNTVYLWMPCLQIDAEACGQDREELMARLGRAKIQRRVRELNRRQQPYRDCGRMPTEGAERLHAITLNIPCSLGLTGPDQARLVGELRGK